jgi:hypothetical protein
MKLLRLGLACGVLFTVMTTAAMAQATTPFVGQIMIAGFNFCPKGWLPANGQLLPINQYVVLYQLYGTTYGGDGKTNFALPDLRDRVIVGTGPITPIGQVVGIATPAPSPIMVRRGLQGLAMTVCISAFGVFPSQN